jgi:hypothetical protein
MMFLKVDSMNTIHDLAETIHLKILEAASRFRQCEAEMIDLIQQVDRHRVFMRKGHPSLFDYATKALRLSENVALNFISIARKAVEVPELKSEIRSGTITFTNARKIVPILTSENKAEWLFKAKHLTLRQLEKEVIKVRPMEATPERVRYVTLERVKLEVGLQEKEMLALRKVQDLMSQKGQRPVSLEEVINVMTQDYLDRHDPVKKAMRQVVRNSVLHVSKHVNSTNTRLPIPKAVEHRVNLRDQRRCTHDSNGKRCNQTRWLDIHHKIPVSEGGQNTLENLTTLCSTHHQYIHLKEPEPAKE